MDFINNNDLMSGKGESGNWITMPNGAKVFVPAGMSKEDAVNAHFEKANEFRRQNKKITGFQGRLSHFCYSCSQYHNERNSLHQLFIQLLYAIIFKKSTIFKKIISEV